MKIEINRIFRSSQGTSFPIFRLLSLFPSGLPPFFPSATPRPRPGANWRGRRGLSAGSLRLRLPPRASVSGAVDIKSTEEKKPGTKNRERTDKRKPKENHTNKGTTRTQERDGAETDLKKNEHENKKQQHKTTHTQKQNRNNVPFTKRQKDKRQKRTEPSSLGDVF